MYKNPFNYIGAKYKLLPQILPLFPKEIKTFIDLFGGSGEVSLNVNADKIIYNEKCKPLVNIFKNLDNKFIDEVERVIQDYSLSKTGKQEFLNLRKYYNDNLNKLSDRENAVILYCLITHAFNYQFAFNSMGKYNMPSGSGRSYFSPQLKSKLNSYIDKINKTDILFENKDFQALDLQGLGEPQDLFIYADPPYLITTGAYERDYFCKWSVENETRLLQYLDEFNNKGYKFALSNVLEHKGKSNDILKKWAMKYRVNFLSCDYKNCNYQLKNKSSSGTVEVLITNYTPNGV